MPPTTTTANTTMMRFEPISGLDLVDRRGQHAGEARKRRAEPVGERQQRGTLTPKAWTSVGVLGRGAQVGAELGLLDQEPGAEADDERGHDHPAAIDRQEHEAEIDAAGERRRRR